MENHLIIYVFLLSFFDVFKLFYSKFSENLKSLMIMGGNLYGIGNITIAAEFNFWFDAQSAHKVVNGISKSVSLFLSN